MGNKNIEGKGIVITEARAGSDEAIAGYLSERGVTGVLTAEHSNRIKKPAGDRLRPPTAHELKSYPDWDFHEQNDQE